MDKVKKILVAIMVISALAASVPAVSADAGGGPGSNHGCPGHQPPPPPAGGCGN